MKRPTRIRSSIAVGLSLGAAALGLLGTAGSASASTTQLAMLQEPVMLSTNATRTLQTLRSLGVGIIRVSVAWDSIASDPSAQTAPADPYPAADFASLDTIVNDAHQYGIAVDLLLTGGAPVWATGSGAAAGYQPEWMPSATLYGQFVQAVAQRYPSVHFWELWNEQNWGPSLAPQVQSGSSAIASAPEYRSLLDSGWSALQQAGHAQDTVIDGSLSPRGSGTLTATDTSPPLAFIRSLYCVDSSYQELSGSAAQAVGCPATPSASQFRANNPALFYASGVGVHPYPYDLPPTKADTTNPDALEFSQIPRLTRTLDRLERLYGANRQMEAYNTEYGYETRPPQTSNEFPTPPTAARYINWAEYLSYKNPRIATTDQYELQDHGWFTTGLVYSNGRLKPSFVAYRMPIWLPVTSTRRGRALEVWGCVRPAHLASLDTHKAQSVSIQFARGGGHRFRTIKTVRITNVRGYFDVRVRFPSSGTVRLAWKYPNGDTRLSDPLTPGQNQIYSRITSIRIA